MEILLYLSAAIAAVSLLLIAIFTVIAVKNAKKTMKEVSDTMDRMETKLSGITTKSDQLMDRSNRIAADVEGKVQRLESVTKSAEHIGNVTENLNESFSTISRQVATPPPEHKEIMKKLTTLTETVSRIFFTFKSEKQKQESYVQEELKQLPSPKVE
jgi:uncharacterized protein YoxC